MTSQDIRTFEVSLQTTMDALANMIDLFGKVAADCEAHAKELEAKL